MITCVQNEVTGGVHYNQDAILRETELHLKNVFNGDFDHIESISASVCDGHNYATQFVETPAPTCTGAGPTSSDHLYNKSSPPKLSSCDNSKSPESDPAGFLDKPFSLEEIQLAISNLHANKAKGWDEIPNECWKNAPQVAIESLLKLFNMMKDQNVLPKKFNHGQITLIHKKGAAELLSNYRPLTVNIYVWYLRSIAS